jgi:LysM repeat protein
MRTRETDPINSSSYEVQAGDTLFRIALRAGTTVQALMAANGLRSAHIYPGQTLVMPAGPRPSPAAPGQGGGASTPGGYGVKAGDTLYQIARQQGVTVQALMAANGLRSVVIRPGQTLIIPGATPRATSTARTSSESNAYTVQGGDTLFRIALNHGVSLQALMAANHLTGTQIRPGQNLVIP